MNKMIFCILSIERWFLYMKLIIIKSFIKDSIPNQKLQIRFCIKRIQEMCRKKIPLFLRLILVTI